MNTETERSSAVIYQFPIRRRADMALRAAKEALSARDAVVTDGWYHADAIRESEPTRHS